MEPAAEAVDDDDAPAPALEPVPDVDDDVITVANEVAEVEVAEIAEVDAQQDQDDNEAVATGRLRGDVAGGVAVPHADEVTADGQTTVMVADVEAEAEVETEAETETVADGDEVTEVLEADAEAETEDPEPELPVGESYETLLATAEQVLDDVDAALVRLRDGTYGTCDVCGDAIGDDVLSALPTARSCDRHLPLPAAS